MRGSRLAWLLASLLLVPLVALAATTGAAKHVKHDHWSDDYDQYFRKYAKHYFGPHVDWHWFKAQGIAESGLRPNAESPAGAKGIMQILPATYEEIKANNPHLANIDDPRWNIAAAIYYDRSLYRKWRKKRDLPTAERLSFAFASYNAGYGNVLKAYGRASKKYEAVRSWQHVSPFAPGETRAYVARIKSLMVIQ